MVTTSALIARVAPDAVPVYVRAFAAGDALLRAHGINRPLRLAHFLTQVLHATGRGTMLFEFLYFTAPARLLARFGEGNHVAAIRAEEVPGLLRNERGLAERVYGLGNPAMAQELGNSEPGDGWRYRGGGLLQTTGRANFRRLSGLAGVDYEANPDLIVDRAYALLPAVQAWCNGGLNIAADRNDIVAITRALTGGLNGLAERRDLFAEIRAVADTLSLAA